MVAVEASGGRVAAVEMSGGRMVAVDGSRGRVVAVETGGARVRGWPRKWVCCCCMQRYTWSGDIIDVLAAVSLWLVHQSKCKFESR